jgi:hypothetical protein
MHIQVYSSVWIGDHPEGYVAKPGDVVEVEDSLGERYVSANYALEVDKAAAKAKAKAKAKTEEPSG